MAITDTDIAQYISSLEIEDGSLVALLFNKLLLIDSSLFRKVIEKLTEGTITVSDLQNIEIINDTNIELFLNSIDTNTLLIYNRRKYFKELLENNFNLSSMKNECLGDFKTYVYKKFLGNINYFINVTIDSLQLSTGSFASFNDISVKWKSIVGFSGDSLNDVDNNTTYTLNDEAIEIKFREFISLFYSIKNSGIYSNPPEILKKAVIDCINKPIFVFSNYNSYPFNKYPIYIYLLSDLYNYNSSNTFNTINNEIINSMINMYDADIYGWAGVHELLQTNTWDNFDLSTKNEDGTIIMDSNIAYIFSKLQLLRYYYPKMYGAYNTEIDLSNEFNTINTYKELFSKAADVVKLIHLKVSNELVATS